MTFEPCGGQAGTQVRILGAGFGATQGATGLFFRGNPATVLGWSDTLITTLVPPLVSAGSQPLRLESVRGTTTLGFIDVFPSIATVTPDSGPVGTVVTLTGANFGTSQAGSTITVAGLAPVVRSWAMTRVVLEIPGVTGPSADIVLHVSKLPSNVAAFRVAGTIVSFTFDDSYSQQLDAAAVLRRHGMHATYYVNSPRIDQPSKPAFFTRDELLALQAEGNEIGGHTLNHLALLPLDDGERLRQICDDRARLIDMGFAVTSLAYPFGVSDAGLRSAAERCGYNSARITDHNREHPWPQSATPPEPYAVGAAPSIATTTSLEKMKSYVTVVEDAGGGWVPLVLHRMCTTCGPEQTTNHDTLAVSILEDFTTWLAARAANGTVVRTVHEVIRGAVKPPVIADAAPPRAESGELVTNGSMELDTNGDGAPDCFLAGAGPPRPAQWSRTSDAHTGMWAMKLEGPTAVPADRRLGLSLDSGSCTIAASAGARFTVSAWYKASGPAAFLLYRRDPGGLWRSWAPASTLPAAAVWTQGMYVTPAAPADTTAIAAVLYLVDSGTMTVDDFSVVRLPP